MTHADFLVLSIANLFIHIAVACMICLCCQKLELCFSTKEYSSRSLQLGKDAAGCIFKGFVHFLFNFGRIGRNKVATMNNKRDQHYFHYCTYY